MRVFIAASLALLAASCGAPQAERPEAASPAPPIAITEAWAAPTPPGVEVGAGYLTITNTQATSDALVAVESTRAGRAEIHEMTMEGAVMRMRAVTRLDIPAGGEARLAPGGQHLMFYKLPTPFSAGETIDVRLRFENAGVVEASLPVRARESGHSGGH